MPDFRIEDLEIPAIPFPAMEPSSWTCYFYGGDDTYCHLVWRPPRSHLPNRWVRFWMRVFLGCTWVKEKK